MGLKTAFLFCGMICGVAAYVFAQPPADEPKAVLEAYLQACTHADLEAARNLIGPAEERAALPTLFQMLPPDFTRQALSEAFCLPLLRQADYRLEEIVVLGQEARARVIGQISLPLTFVLQRDGPQGPWRLALRESILSTTGAAEPLLLRGELDTGGRERSAQAICLSNLRQLALAALMYAQDHDGLLPPAESWRDELQPYVKNTTVFICPENPWGYTYNAQVTGKRLLEIKRPAETILFFEALQPTPTMAADPAITPLSDRHNNGCGFAYVDGHVKWQRGDAAGQ